MPPSGSGRNQIRRAAYRQARRRSGGDRSASSGIEPRLRYNRISRSAVKRLGAQPHRTGLTVSSGTAALAARLYHETIGAACLVSAEVRC